MNELKNSENDIMVSIVCLTYNHELFVEKAIKGFLMQKTNFKYEIIIHDDASTDGTANIIKKYAEQYPEVFVPILQTENQYSKHVKITPKIAREKARGKYIALCEGDDYWIDENKLQKQFDYMEMHPTCSICGHNSYYLDNQKRDEDNLRYIVNKTRSNIRFTIEDFLEERNVPITTTASLFIRREVFPNYSWSNRFSFGDLFFMLSALNSGYFFYFNEPMSIYRINNTNSYNGRMHAEKDSVQKVEKLMEYQFELIEALEYFNCETSYRWDASIKVAKKYRMFQCLPALYLKKSCLENSGGFLLCKMFLWMHPSLEQFYLNNSFLKKIKYFFQKLYS